MHLNNKQILFCLEYIKNGCNGTQAYINTYTKSTYDTAKSNANKLLKRDDVKQYIEHLKQEQYNKCNIEIDEIQEHLITIVRDDNIFSLVTTNDRLKALDMLNKMKGNYIVQK